MKNIFLNSESVDEIKIDSFGRSCRLIIIQSYFDI